LIFIILSFLNVLSIKFIFLAIDTMN